MLALAGQPNPNKITARSAERARHRRLVTHLFRRDQSSLAHDHGNLTANKLRNYHEKSNRGDRGIASSYREARGPHRHQGRLESGIGSPRRVIQGSQRRRPGRGCGTASGSPLWSSSGPRGVTPLLASIPWNDSSSAIERNTAAVFARYLNHPPRAFPAGPRNGAGQERRERAC